MRRALLVMAVACVAGAGLTLAAPAFTQAGAAVGDPTLSHLILKNPLPGLQEITPPNLRSDLQNLVNSTGADQTGAKAAIGTWYALPNKVLEIVLVSFQGGIPAGDILGTDISGTVGIICSGAKLAAPSSTQPVPGVSPSAMGTCFGSLPAPLGGQAVVADWTNGNVFGAVVGINLTSAQVVSATSAQAAAIPAGGVHEAGSSSSSNAGLWIGIGVGAVVLAGLVVFFVVRARRRRQTPAPTWPGAYGWPGGAYGSAPPDGSYGAAPAFYGAPVAPGPNGAPVATGAPYGGQGAMGATYGSPVPQQAGAWSATPAAAPPGWGGYTEPGAVTAWAGTPMPAGGPVGPAMSVPAATAAPTPAGWYPVNGQPDRLGYFDGTGWTAFRHWDGQAWVEST